MTPDRSHILLVNPSSGGGRTAKLVPEVEHELGRRGIAYRTVQTRTLEHGVEEALGAAKRGEVPVVMSGDGLIGQIGGALARSGADVAMGIIPGGRGNDLARVLGIPSEIPSAVALLGAATERVIDVGLANERPFLCIASCGFDSECNRVANETRIVRGNLVYAYSVLRVLAAWRPAKFTVSVDGERHEFSGYSVAAANSRAYGGGMMVAPDAILDDGLLDVVLTAYGSKLRFLANLPKVFKGTHVQLPQVAVLRGAEVEISADRPFEVYADGEHLTDLPARIRVLPRALRVIAPPDPAST